MNQKMSKLVKDYIERFPPEAQAKLQELRLLILKTVPEAQEIISYGMPAYKVNTVLVYFAGYAKHIGFYPTAACIAAFQKEISGYKHAKGAVQFAIDKKLPIALITKMLKYRQAMDASKSDKKKILKTCPNGHQFYKSSNCLSCPECQRSTKAKAGFLSMLSAPARRALQGLGISNIKQLSTYSQDEILQLHGLGKSSLLKLRDLLKQEGKEFKKSTIPKGKFKNKH